MEIVFLCVIVFLFMLAVFDLSVGVSNDAVNFLNSAMGSKAASLKVILTVASVGVFIGAAMSNGMMDIARHGIFRPEHFSFYDLLCIFMAVMVTDIILLDIFNTLGMPTSTTVSMVFELLGATFVVALLKLASDTNILGLDDFLNTEKALSVIIGIFLSVAIAFVFGTIVQFITRMIFTFDYRSRMKWKIGLFGGICATAIVYFLLIKGIKDMALMTPEIKSWIKDNTMQIIAACLVGFTLIMQLLHFLKVNVLKVIVLMGTFALAMAFAGNDLVNFIGVPLSGLSSYMDFASNGSGDAKTFMMDSLNGPADTSIWFLIGAGLIMVVALSTSRKARKVSQTEIGLGSRSAGEEMFGSSRISRRIVRWSLSLLAWIRCILPINLRRWLNARFNADEAVIDRGAAFDLVRGAVNLVLAGALIAVGTSLKLPLSTTFVTFMVAMGTSLSDRAWGRESAVFRITGVISVIGGWFLTAGCAFIGAGIIVLLMHLGGQWVMFALGILTIVLIVRSNRRFRRQTSESDGDVMFEAVLSAKKPQETWRLFLIYTGRKQMEFVAYAIENFRTISEAFIGDNVKALDRCDRSLSRYKQTLKNMRRKETLCFRKVDRGTAIRMSAWFHLGNNCCMSMLYNLRRINEICKEHVENNFLPLPSVHARNLEEICTRVTIVFNDTLVMMEGGEIEAIELLRRQCDEVKDMIADVYHSLHEPLRSGDTSEISVLYVYLNVLQESQELMSGLRKFLRAYGKMRTDDYRDRVLYSGSQDSKILTT